MNEPTKFICVMDWERRWMGGNCLNVEERRAWNISKSNYFVLQTAKCRSWSWTKWGQTFISILTCMVWITECVSLSGQLYCLPFGWNILETNRTVGGLFGYSSENSIRSLNVPAERQKESGGGGGEQSERQRGERVCEGCTQVILWGEYRCEGRIEGVRESERNNYVTKNTAGSTRRRS